MTQVDQEEPERVRGTGGIGFNSDPSLGKQPWCSSSVRQEAQMSRAFGLAACEPGRVQSCRCQRDADVPSRQLCHKRGMEGQQWQRHGTPQGYI